MNDPAKEQTIMLQISYKQHEPQIRQKMEKLKETRAGRVIKVNLKNLLL